MKRYQKILVPYDDSKLSKLAFEQAVSLAAMVGGEITVINVIEPYMAGQINFDFTEIGFDIDPIIKINKKRVKSILSALVKLGNMEGVVVHFKIKDGNIANEIIGESSNYDIIIMGTLGQSAIKTLLLGSVAEKVARHACCPVMLVRERGKECLALE